MGVHRAGLARMTVLIESDRNKEWSKEPRRVCMNSEMEISTQEVTGSATERKQPWKGRGGQDAGPSRGRS